MRSFDTSRDDPADIRAALMDAAVAADDPETEAAVREIITRVRVEGDAALIEYTRRFDSPGVSIGSVAVPRSEIARARRMLSTELLDALDQAARNIQEFHQREAGHIQSWMHLAENGRFLGQVMRPVRRVGVYVPGGHAAYPSTVLMCAIPASVAGVDEVIVCTPPGPSGEIPPPVLAACQGWADRVFRVGGAQAIAAMAYGTESVPRVDVVVGPGSRFVNAAKRQVYGTVGIDMLAGPSEVCIIADSGANPRYVAADLLAQTEHGQDNVGVVLTDDADMAAQITSEIDAIMSGLQRQEVLRETSRRSALVTTRSLSEAADYANLMAPEHLQLMVRDPMALVPLIHNAGAVLLGDYTAAAFGDYVAGPSHTLPTAGSARFSSPLSVATFMKRTNVMSYTAAAARMAGIAAGRIADAEGFDGHALSARIRIEGAQS